MNKWNKWEIFRLVSQACFSPNTGKSQIQSKTVTERLKKDKAGGLIYLTCRKSTTDVKNI